MDNNLKRTIILEHYQNPKNKGLIDDDSYIHINMNNESCIDEINLMVKIENDKIKDIRFDGEACAIATSSLSIAINKLIGKTKKEALNIIDNYNKMISGENFNKEILEELIIYEDVSKQPARVKCATLGIDGIKDLLKK